MKYSWEFKILTNHDFYKCLGMKISAIIFPGITFLGRDLESMEQTPLK
jgi:hypothetical protein